MNHCYFSFTSLSIEAILGDGNTVTSWEHWRGNCQQCGRKVKSLNGLFCANFCYTRGLFSPCHNVWCHECYVTDGQLKFPVKKNSDMEEGFDLEDDENSFMYARKGDEFMTTFQYELCHFRNIQKKNPKSQSPDMVVLSFIRRANLDAFWARKPSTVVRNRGLVIKSLEMAEELNLPRPFPDRGPLPLKDQVGMLQAILQLRRTMDQGLYGEFIQFTTARKLRSAYSTFFQASKECGNVSVMAKETKKLLATTNPVYGIWYENFMKGLHERMGDDYRPDLAISIDLLHALLRYCNTTYLTAVQFLLQKEQWKWDSSYAWVLQQL